MQGWPSDLSAYSRNTVTALCENLTHFPNRRFIKFGCICLFEDLEITGYCSQLSLKRLCRSNDLWISLTRIICYFKYIFCFFNHVLNISILINRASPFKLSYIYSSTVFTPPVITSPNKNAARIRRLVTLLSILSR